MDPVLAAILVYSAQVAVVVAAAGTAEALARIASPGVRLAWWRIVAIACLALPLFASSSVSEPTVSSITFAAAPGAAGSEEQDFMAALRQGTVQQVDHRFDPAIGPRRHGFVDRRDECDSHDTWSSTTRT